jgi:hypothetical protein
LIKLAATARKAANASAVAGVAAFVGEREFVERDDRRTTEREGL